MQHPPLPLERTPSLGTRLAVFLVGLFAFLQVYSIQAVLPEIVDEFGASPSVAGFSVGVTVLAIALISPFAGVLSDRIGRKSMIVPAVVGLAIPTTLLFFVDNILWLNTARFFQGLFVPAMTVVVLAYIAEEFPSKVATITATYVMGTVLGGFLGRFLLGHLNTLIGWRLGFLVMGALTLLGALVITICLPKSTAFIKNNDNSLIKNFGIHLKNPHLLLLCFLGGCVLFGLVGSFTFINLHLAKAPYFLSTSALANLFTVYLLGMVITPLSTSLIARFGTKKTLFFAIGLSMVGLMITLSTPLWLIIFGLTAICTGVFITQTATISQLSKTVNQGRSLANGLYYSGYYLGGVVGSYLCGIAFTHYAWLGVVVMIFLVQALGLILVGLSQESPQAP